MGSPSELTLDFRPHDQSPNLEDFLSRLEKERVKIEAFKRELPLSMQLLNNAMDTYRKQLGMQRPVLEEFMPLKNASFAEEKSPAEDDVAAEKTTWMTTAQLWGGAATAAGPPPEKAGGGGVRGGLPELALASTEKEEEKGGEIRVAAEREKTVAAVAAQRKARRCWTPELHRRFVSALHVLGGSQVATPKQIRELMNVEGLTNDEVKSHLQKYRLHTRRPMAAPQTSTSAAPPQLVVLGGIWVPPEYTGSSAGAKAGQIFYGGHPAAAHYCAAAAVQQEFYPGPMHPHQYHNHGTSSPARAALAPPRNVKRESPEERGSSGSTHSTEEDDGVDGDDDDDDDEEEEKGRASVAGSTKDSEDKDGKRSRIRLKL